MQISNKELILGVAVTLLGAAIMTAGFGFSETVNVVSVLGILIGTQVILLGLGKVFLAVRKMHVQAKVFIKDAESIIAEPIPAPEAQLANS